MTFLREETCPGCKMKTRVYEMELVGGPDKGKKIEITPRETIDEVEYGCKCEDIALAKKSLNSLNNLKTAKMKQFFNRYSLINKDLQQASFETYQASNQSQAKAKMVAERFVEVFDKDKPINLLFSGTYGVGKSHLAKSITDEIIKKQYKVIHDNGREEWRPYSAIFISVPKLLTKFRASYNKDSDYSEGDIIEMLNNTDVLVLDDLGAEKSSEWAWEKLFEIVDSRQGLHTIYTSNYNPNDLEAKLGERNFSRIVNRDTTVVEIDGDNYRLGKFAKGAM